MGKINTRSFVRATRATARGINRRIVLNLVREHQLVSRVDLVRRMRIGRGMVTSLVAELLTDGSIYEGSTAQAPRGRVLSAPQFGWRDVDVRAALEKATDLPVLVEDTPIACALAPMWLGDADKKAPRDFVYLAVGDGVGAGVGGGAEITALWDRVAPVMRRKIRDRARTPRAAEAPLVPDPASSYPRLSGATAIVAVPVYAAPQVA
jgi:hypothetical protein